MNKIAIIFIPIIFALHFLMAPQNLIPNGWMENIQQGKKVAQLFISFYRSQSAAANSIQRPKAEAAHPPQPLVHNDLIAMADLRPADQTMDDCDLAFQKLESQIRHQVRSSLRIAIIRNEILAAAGPGQATLVMSGL